MKKLLNKKGFTLMEMLIVIAIIVILIAIAVPNFNNSLDAANKATDKANFRAAESAGMILAQDEANVGNVYVYSANGTLELTNPDSGTGYSASDADYGKCSVHKGENGGYIEVTIESLGNVEVKWSNAVECD